jgi:hypothetical protein
MEELAGIYESSPRTRSGKSLFNQSLEGDKNEAASFNAPMEHPVHIHINPSSKKKGITCAAQSKSDLDTKMSSSTLARKDEDAFNVSITGNSCGIEVRLKKGFGSFEFRTPIPRTIFVNQSNQPNNSIENHLPGCSEINPARQPFDIGTLGGRHVSYVERICCSKILKKKSKYIDAIEESIRKEERDTQQIILSTMPSLMNPSYPPTSEMREDSNSCRLKSHRLYQRDELEGRNELKILQRKLRYQPKQMSSYTLKKRETKNSQRYSVRDAYSKKMSSDQCRHLTCHRATYAAKKWNHFDFSN